MGSGSMAGPTGFEPVTPGYLRELFHLRVRCSSLTELRALLRGLCISSRFNKFSFLISEFYKSSCVCDNELRKSTVLSLISNFDCEAENVG